MKKSTIPLGIIVAFVLFISLQLPAILYAQDNLVLWNKLGSDTEVFSSEHGPDFEIFENQGEVLYVNGQFGDAIATTGGTASTGPAGGYLSMDPDLFFPTVKNKGTVEFWTQKRIQRLIPYQSSLLTFFGRQRYATGYASISGYWTDDQPMNKLSFSIYGGDGIWYQATETGWDGVPAGQWVHLAFVWDGSGIDESADDMRIYRDGNLVASHQGQFSEIKPFCCVGYNCGESYCDTGGYEVRVMANHEGRRLTGCSQNLYSYCPTAYMDNIKVWDYAKTDFSDRFIENPILDRVCNQNNHCYQRFDETMSWHMASAHCESKNGYLVTITSQDEQDFVFDKLAKNSPNDCWIGATDEATAEKEEVWHWFNEEKWKYDNWGTDQPDNGDGLEHYAAMNTDGKWQDKMSLNNGSGRCDCPIEFEPMSTICEWGDILGDLNGDNNVNEGDYEEFRNTYGRCSGDSGFNSKADYDKDECVSLKDYRIWYTEYYMN